MIVGRKTQSVGNELGEQRENHTSARERNKSGEGEGHPAFGQDTKKSSSQRATKEEETEILKGREKIR